MTEAKSNIYRLPVEIQTDIIRRLDPVSLFSLSQVSIYFRKTINPGPKERLEQLLVLECLEQFGGQVAVHGKNHGYERMSDQSEIRGWEKFRWACSSCLRLLPHNHFGNKAIFHAEHRKPHPRFVPKNPRTSWPSKTIFETGLLRRCPSPSPHPRRDEEEEDENARDYERDYLNEDFSTGDSEDHRQDVGAYRQYWGYNRHHRKCISCLHDNDPPEAKQFDWPLGDHKTVAVTIPALRTRRVNYLSLLDRYFPGCLDTLTAEGEARQSDRVKGYRHRVSYDNTPYALAMVKCPSCKAWKELRSFLIRGVPWHGGWPQESDAEMHRALCLRLLILEENKDQICCSVCFVKEYDQDALGKALVPWFKALVDWELKEEVDRMRCGWEVFNEVMDKRKRGVPRGLRKKMAPLMDELTVLFNNQFYLLDLTPELATRLRVLYEEFLPHAINIKRAYDERKLIIVWQFEYWVHGYPHMHDQWTWLQKTKDLVESNPLLLSEWALKMDSHHFNVLHMAEKPA